MAPKMSATYQDIIDYLLHRKYPAAVQAAGHGKKKNFRRIVSNFEISDGSLYKFIGRAKTRRKLLVITDENERGRIVSSAHVGDSLHSKATGGHLGQDKTEVNILKRFWWPTVRKDVRNFIKTCDSCHCQRTAPRVERVPHVEKEAEQLPRVDVLSHPLLQIWVDTCAMPTSTEGCSCMVVAVDLFTKWIEAEPLFEKNALAVARFLYILVCRFGYCDIRLNDTRQEFVDAVASELHRLTGVQQKLTGACHPQSSGLAERDNTAIRDRLVKRLTTDVEDVNLWPEALPGALLALRTSPHTSTGYTPFMLLYGREANMPVGVTATNESRSVVCSNQNGSGLGNSWSSSGKQQGVPSSENAVKEEEQKQVLAWIKKEPKHAADTDEESDPPPVQFNSPRDHQPSAVHESDVDDEEDDSMLY